MGKSTTTSNDWLNYALKGTLFSWNASTSVYIALHTADPTAAGDQTSSETSYTNYQRVPVIRTAAGWTVSTNTASNAALIQFAQCGVTGATLKYVSIGINPSGAGQILWSGQLNADLTVANLIQPQFNINALQIQET
jgi:hypothetical protein